ncbi:hypothetical protein [Vulcanisaeta sp. JCM 16161]|uniref:hypothetical protein n=1 Tax=Vulcanisaeta sp. JCM 16161 TaxID=1295372 RepID=UPI00406C1E7D
MSITSPLPITVNGATTANYTSWVWAGSLLNLTTSNVYLTNGTMFAPSVGNESIIVSSPISMGITWTPYYLVNITSEYPVRVNGTLTREYSAYVRAGSTIVVRADPVAKYLGLVIMHPNATSLTIVVNKPVRLFIAYTPNYTNLLLLMFLIALALAVALMRGAWAMARTGARRFSYRNVGWVVTAVNTRRACGAGVSR